MKTNKTILKAAIHAIKYHMVDTRYFLKHDKKNGKKAFAKRRLSYLKFLQDVSKGLKKMLKEVK